MLTRLCVLGAQIAAVTGYTIYLLTDAPPAFSIEDWLFLLIPPLLFASLLVLGLRLRPNHPGWLRAANGLGTGATALVLAGTLLLIPVWVLGNLTEM